MTTSQHGQAKTVGEGKGAARTRAVCTAARLSTFVRMVLVVIAALHGGAWARSDAMLCSTLASGPRGAAAGMRERCMDAHDVALLVDQGDGGGAACEAACAAHIALACNCCYCGAKGAPHATAPLRAATMLRSQGGGEEAGGAWPGRYGRQRGVDKDRGAIATIPSGPVPHHGGWRQGVDGAATVPSGALGRASTTATVAAAADHYHHYWEEGRSDTVYHPYSITMMTRGGGGGKDRRGSGDGDHRCGDGQQDCSRCRRRSAVVLSDSSAVGAAARGKGCHHDAVHPGHCDDRTTAMGGEGKGHGQGQVPPLAEGQGQTGDGYDDGCNGDVVCHRDARDGDARCRGGGEWWMSDGGNDDAGDEEGAMSHDSPSGEQGDGDDGADDDSSDGGGEADRGSDGDVGGHIRAAAEAAATTTMTRGSAPCCGKAETSRVGDGDVPRRRDEDGDDSDGRGIGVIAARPRTRTWDQGDATRSYDRRLTPTLLCGLAEVSRHDCSLVGGDNTNTSPVHQPSCTTREACSLVRTWLLHSPMSTASEDCPPRRMARQRGRTKPHAQPRGTTWEALSPRYGEGRGGEPPLSRCYGGLRARSWEAASRGQACRLCQGGEGPRRHHLSERIGGREILARSPDSSQLQEGGPAFGANSHRRRVAEWPARPIGLGQSGTPRAVLGVPCYGFSPTTSPAMAPTATAMRGVLHQHFAEQHYWACTPKWEAIPLGRRMQSDDGPRCDPLCLRARRDDDLTGAYALVATTVTHVVMLATLQILVTVICIAARSLCATARAAQRAATGKMDGRRVQRSCSAAVRVGTARITQRKPRRRGAAGLRAMCRRCEAGMLAYLLISAHAFAQAGGRHGGPKKYFAERQGPTRCSGHRPTVVTPWSAWSHDGMIADATTVTEGLRLRPSADDRNDHSWYHALRVGEADNPGPTQPTVLAVGLLRKANDRIRAAISYPRPGARSLRGAVAPGFESCEGSQRGQGDGANDTFALKVEAVNGTGWRALQRRLLATEAHVVLAQETWLTQDAVPAASAWARRRGWQSIWSAAVAGPSGGASGGVAILVREGIGCHYPPEGSHVISPGRAVAAVVQPPGHRPTIFTSCYLHHGKGPNGDNLEILAAIGKRIKGLSSKFEFIIGGDLNMEPPDVASTGIQEELDATILTPATSRGTFRGPTTSSLLDYYIASNRIAAAVNSVRVVEASGIKGHTPVVMEFKPCTTTLRALHLRKPPSIGLERVNGPLPPPPDWTAARRTAEEALRAARRKDKDVQRFLDDAYRAWADLSEEELADFTGTPPKKWGERGRLPNLVWRSVVPERTPRVEHPHAAAAAWLSAAAREVKRINRESERAVGDTQRDVLDDINTDPIVDTAGAIGERQIEAEVARARGRKPPVTAEGCIRVLEELLASLDHDMPNCGDGLLAEELCTLKDRVRAASEGLRRRLLTENEQGRGREERRSEGHDRGGEGGPLEDQRNSEEGAIEELCTDIEEFEAKTTAHVKAEDDRRWREWVSEGIDQGASRAHAYTRLPKAWTPTTTTLPDGVMSSSVDDLMAEQRRKYRDLWKPMDTPFRYEWTDDEELPAMTADHLRATAGTFAARTAATYDGFHPRQLGSLSDGSLDTLGIVLAAVEVSGIWPRQISLVVATLLPKPAGGYRPIGLAPAVYRLWSKARRTTADEWEQRHRRSFFAACSGNGPLDALWRMTARHEAGIAEGEVAASVTEDLQSFFENIDRDHLLAEAAALGFPLPIVRAALAAYSSARMLSMGGRMGREMYPTIGVVAGCSLAMVLTKIYCLRALEEYAREAPPGVKLDTFVDDFTLSMIGKPNAVVEGMLEAHSRLREVVENTLRCRFAPGKTAVTATTRQLASTIARRIGVTGGVVGIATLLGVDNAAAAPRAALRAKSKRAKRLRAALARKKRLQQVQRVVGSKAKKVFVAGIRPAATYGSQIWGLDDGEVGRLRRLAAAALRPQARGRSLRLTLLWHDVPTAAAENAPLTHFARMVWAATIRRQDAEERGSSIADIRRMWEEASSTFLPLVAEYRKKQEQLKGEDIPIAFTRKLWRQVRGPLGAAALTAARIGWTFTNPFTVRDHLGAEMLFTNSTPAMVAKRAHEALRGVIERSVAAKWAGDDPQYAERRACLDLIIYTVNNDKQLTPYQKGVMRSATCGAIMTGDKAIKMGYKVDGQCPLCGQARDTLAHRIYHCPCTCEAVSAVVPEWFLKEARRASPADRFWTTGVCPNPGDLAPPPPEGMEVKVKRMMQRDDDGEDELIAVSDRIYIDGSSTTPVIRSMARAATAVVQTTNDGTPVKVLQVAVPRHLPQTAQAAEHLGIGLVIRALRGKAQVVGDCLNVVQAANGKGRDPFAPTKVYAGILLDTHADPGRRRLAGEIQWTRAHRKVVGNESDEVLRDIRGNAAADREAREALGEHPPLGALAESQAEFFQKRVAHVVKAATTALALFPRASGKMERNERPANATQARERRRHLWAFRGGAWRCELCDDWLTGDKLPRARVTQRCSGKTLADGAKAMAQRGHSLYKAAAGVPFVYCCKCGAWGNRRSLRLASPCGPPAASGVQALARIRKRQHPLQRKGPKGVLQRREVIRTVAKYDLDDGAWHNIGERVPDTTNRDERTEQQDRHVGLALDPPAEMLMEASSCADPCGIQEEEDVFGHGGSLDEGGGVCHADDRGQSSHIDRAAGQQGPRTTASGMSSGEAGSSGGGGSMRRQAKSIRGTSGGGSTMAAVHRMMVDSRPPANDGAMRLAEVKKRVLQRVQRSRQEAGNPNARGPEVSTLEPGGSDGAEGAHIEEDSTYETGRRNVRPRTNEQTPQALSGGGEALVNANGNSCEGWRDVQRDNVADGDDYRLYGNGNSECQHLGAEHATLDVSPPATRRAKRPRSTSISPGSAPFSIDDNYGTSSGEEGERMAYRGGGEPAHVGSDAPSHGSEDRKKGREEADRPPQPRRGGGSQRRQPSALASTAQPRLRRRRGSPEGEGPVEMCGSGEYSHQGYALGATSTDRAHSPFVDPRNLNGERLSRIDSPNPRALLPPPRGEARDDADRRGEQRNGCVAEVAEADARLLGRPGAQRGPAHGQHGATRGRDEARVGAEPAGRAKRRRIRGKQSLRTVEEASSPPASEEGQQGARAAFQRAIGDNAGRAIADRPNSVQLTASAGTSRSSSGDCDFFGSRGDHHVQALRSAGGAAGQVAAGDNSGRGGIRERELGDSGGGPSRYVSHLLTEQRSSVASHRDGPQPAVGGAATVQSWSPSGGRPPDGAAYAV